MNKHVFSVILYNITMIKAGLASCTVTTVRPFICFHDTVLRFPVIQQESTRTLSVK